MNTASFSATPPLPNIAQTAIEGFADRFGHPPHWLSIAPGRVNVIGEHIDYNDGFVLPIGIDRYTAIAAAPSRTSKTQIASRETSEPLEFIELDLTGQPDWAPYVIGPLLLCAEADLHTGPLDAWIASDVPRGAGLSSSAALEVATATLAETICKRSLDSMQKARLCQQAEHRFAHVPCGIMDQATSVAAEADAALLLDCQGETWTTIPFGGSQVCLLIANTNVRHHLADGQYASRRNECAAALDHLGASSYRDLDLQAVTSSSLDETLLRRARHVVSEISRTQAAAQALAAGDWPRLGTLMNESHLSLRDDYQVSCDELDTMAHLAWELGLESGVFGSRMTGGGFGGCTVSLILAEQATDIATRLGEAYRTVTTIEPDLFLVQPSSGARGLSCPIPPESEKPA